MSTVEHSLPPGWVIAIVIAFLGGWFYYSWRRFCLYRRVAERPIKLAIVRTMIKRLLRGIDDRADMDGKIESIKLGMRIMGQTWDPAEGPLWVDLIEYVENGGQLTDDYLITWRRRYRSVLGIG